VSSRRPFPRTRPTAAVRAALGASLTLLALACLAASAGATVPEWTTYHHDNARSGIDPDSTNPLPPAQAWQTGGLGGSIWAEPLVYGSHVYVATESDTIYSLDTASGQVAWARHLGTPVPSGDLPCGDIEPVVGITSTPVIDPSTHTIYAVMDTENGGRPETIRHELVALDLETGAMRAGFPTRVDPPFPEGGSAANQLQRTALGLDGNEVVIGYGGNDGDCNTYWGWLVGAPTSGGGPLATYQVDSQPGHDEGAIWGAGNGPAIDSSGDVYAATGNGDSGSAFDFGDSVLKLDPALALLAWWAPADWQELDESDADLGSSDPILIPGGYLFEIGKQGVGVLLRTNALGGTAAAPAAELPICSGSWGGAIFVPSSTTAGTLYVTCIDGLRAISVSSLGSAEPQLSPSPSWTVPSGAVGPPIFAGGRVWVASWNNEPGDLYGLDPTSGAVTFKRDLGSFMHFSTPSAGGGRLFVANGEQVTAYTIATFPPSPTSTSLTPSANPARAGTLVTFTAGVSPAPDGGSVTFTDGGKLISPGCTAVAIGESAGRATCTTAYTATGSHTIEASYSGDQYFTGSSATPLHLTVVARTRGPGARLLKVSNLRQSHLRWREGGRLPRATGVAGAAAQGHVPVGTVFSFSLGEAASLTLRFERLEAGRRVAGRCRPPTGANRHRHRCRRAVRAGVLSFGGRAGPNRVSFEGRLSRTRRLAPGRYRLVVTASEGRRHSPPRSLGFTIVR